MADKWTSETRGADVIIRKISRIAKESGEYIARVKTRSTTGYIRRVRSADERESRSEVKNIIILRTQAKKGRNVVFFNDQERAIINAIWRDGIVDVINARHGQLLRRASHVASKLKQVTIDHINKSQGKYGPVKPVKSATQKRKDREGIRPGLPPLINTGQLIQSLTPLAIRKR